jgi:hypothetical protein
VSSIATSSSNIAEIAASLRGSSAPVTGETSLPEGITYGGTEGDESYVTAAESTVDNLDADSATNGDTATDSQSGAANATDAKQNASKDETPAGSESIVVTDESGKRRRISVDWNNKEQLKKYVQLAHGARKWQAERDQALSARTEVEGKLKELASNWETLENTYQSRGIAGLVDLLEGRTGAFDDWEKSRIDRYNFLQKATPAQKELFEAKERAAARDAELERIRKENEDFRNSIVAEKEQASLKSLESTVHPAFDRYRFADKLGDADTEHMFDEMLWNNALKRLEPYEEKGVPLTADLVEKEFKAVATALRKRINVQAEKKAANAVEQKKREATENAQAAVSAGYRSPNVSQEAMKLASEGNIGAIFKNWSKYGKAFGK